MATVYVSPTGDDSRTYVQAQNSATPWQTIGKCNTSAVSGDTIVVMAGTHTWSTITFSAKSFYIQGQTSDASLYILDTGAVTAAIWNFTLTGGLWDISNVRFYRGLGDTALNMNALTSSTLNLTNCIIDSITNGASYSCFLIAQKTSTVNITNCNLRSLEKSGGTGKQFAYFANTACSLTMTGNTIYATASNALFGSSTSNNTIVMKNNIVVFAGSTPYSTGSGTFSNTATYNDFYNVSSSPAGTGNITSDPLFVDATNNNFNLRQTSPCIGTGSV